MSANQPGRKYFLFLGKHDIALHQPWLGFISAEANWPILKLKYRVFDDAVFDFEANSTPQNQGEERIQPLSALIRHCLKSMLYLDFPKCTL